MSNDSIIDWFKLKAQFGHQDLLKHWLTDFIAGSDQELAQLQLAVSNQQCPDGLLLQLQGMAALVASPSLHRCVQQLKHSEQLTVDLESTLRCYQQLVSEITHYLHQH
ncbi:hypothetical protein [Agarivorans sp. 1_MG-2023]|uniref:hypothetical protein n=1 Tax=Agarivorans sp. 1_MG-2023 TaxID=3062634 RepID=UPI0026E39050|nr:hypothetical protein [Agarivorans sp. 1_MG-2023]MDO6764903.1 hypothetical protein [Agarivorans sp. 1_MG-2023]